MVREEYSAFNKGPCSMRFSICNVCVHMLHYNCVHSSVGPGLCKHTHTPLDSIPATLASLGDMSALSEAQISCISQARNLSHLSPLEQQNWSKLFINSLTPSQINVLATL
ncbi:hypothetical protein B566_EDAN018324, partial [Ephemera danica]